MKNTQNLKIAAAGALFIISLSGYVCAHAQNVSDLSGAQPTNNAIWLDSLDVSKFEQDFGDPHAGKSILGQPLTIDGTVFQHGVGTHSTSKAEVELDGQATKFISYVGVDDERKTSTRASVQFSVKVDGVQKTQTDVMRGGMAPELISVDLTGAKTLELDVSDAGDGNTDDHADWAGAQIVMTSGAKSQPKMIDLEAIVDGPARLKPAPISNAPVIHGASIVGMTPGHDFLFLIPATGERPMTFNAVRLPKGLSLDKSTGIITGTIQSPGRYQMTLSAHNKAGTASEAFTIVAGQHKLALTPPMGWNSWNVFAGNVDQGKVQDAAQAMIDAGLAQHGYEYVNIDDTWEAGRDSAGNIQSNSKFPDMKGLAASIHAKGLHVGLYSSPGPTTCAGYTASYQHEEQDAKTYATWGFDYLKYDWCSYGQIAAGDNSLPMFQKPYQVMRTALDNADRDIVYSLCQYGMGDVWTWGADPSVAGNCWRTTGDIRDTWRSMYGILESQAGHEVYAGPGHWNDPDMLVLGSVGWGTEHPTRLHPNEQLVHFSMWCMLSAPLLIGCDMTKLDPLTREILTNDEVIAIDQDPLGKPASRVAPYAGEGGEIWTRPLVGGSTAVALINPSESDETVTANWKQLGINGPRNVRDLWLHKELGARSDTYSVKVPAHGIVLLKLSDAMTW